MATSSWKSNTIVSVKDLLTRYFTISISECKKATEVYLELDEFWELNVNNKSQIYADLHTRVVTIGENYKIEVKNGNLSVMVRDVPTCLTKFKRTISYIRKAL